MWTPGRYRLFHKTALEAVASAERQQGVAGNEALALRFLRRALTGEMVTLATAAFNDEFREAEAGATVSLPWRDRPVAYNDLSSLIAQESDAQKRAQAFAAMNAVRVRKLNPILERKEQAAQKAARETGFADYVALSEDLRSVKLDPLLASGVAYVKATDALFRKTLDRVAREELDTPREKLRVRDLGASGRRRAWRRFFDKQLELKALQAFLSGIGLDLRTAKGTEVQVDDSLNPKKVPRAFVEPVDAPGDVRLSVKPSGGLDDYETLFHEAGHAVHFANATAAPRELVTQGYGAPTEAFGEFFRQAFSDPHWLFRYRAFLEAQGRPSPSERGARGHPAGPRAARDDVPAPLCLRQDRLRAAAARAARGGDCPRPGAALRARTRRKRARASSTASSSRWPTPSSSTRTNRSST